MTLLGQQAESLAVCRLDHGEIACIESGDFRLPETLAQSYNRGVDEAEIEIGIAPFEGGGSNEIVRQQVLETV